MDHYTPEPTCIYGPCDLGTAISLIDHTFALSTWRQITITRSSLTFRITLGRAGPSARLHYFQQGLKPGQGRSRVKHPKLTDEGMHRVHL